MSLVKSYQIRSYQKELYLKAVENLLFRTGTT